MEIPTKEQLKKKKVVELRAELSKLRLPQSGELLCCMPDNIYFYNFRCEGRFDKTTHRSLSRGENHLNGVRDVIRLIYRHWNRRRQRTNQLLTMKKLRPLMLSRMSQNKTKLWRLKTQPWNRPIKWR